MSVFERIASKRRRDTLDGSTETPSRVICGRCRREYTPEPDAHAGAEYCWWCAARISQTEIFVVPE